MKIWLFFWKNIYEKFIRWKSIYLWMIFAFSIISCITILAVEVGLRQYDEMQAFDLDKRTYILNAAGECNADTGAVIDELLADQRLPIERINNFSVSCNEMIKISDTEQMSFFAMVITDISDESRIMAQCEDYENISGKAKIFLSKDFHDCVCSNAVIGDVINFCGNDWIFCGYAEINSILLEDIPYLDGFEYSIDNVCFEYTLDEQQMVVLSEYGHKLGSKEMILYAEKYDNGNTKEYVKYLLLICFLLVVSGLNVVLLFYYISVLEYDELCIYKLCGIRNGTSLLMYSGESLIYITAGFVCGAVLESVISCADFMSEFHYRLSAAWYAVIMCVYILLEFLVNLPLLIRLVKRSPIECIRG